MKASFSQDIYQSIVDSTPHLDFSMEHVIMTTKKIQLCRTDFWKNSDVDPRNGSCVVYKHNLIDIFNNHDAEDLFFLYRPSHNVHSLIEAPDEWLNIYSVNSTCK